MRSLFAHIQIKFVCLLLACGLWFYVSHLKPEGGTSSATRIGLLRIADVPVRFEGNQASQLVVDPPVVSLAVQWRPEDAIQYASLGQIYAVIPSDVIGKTTAYSLSMRDFVLPPGWQIHDIEPSEIRLKPLIQGSE